MPRGIGIYRPGNWRIKMKIGDFVTARTTDEKVRQGVVIVIDKNNYTILGESGTKYICEGKGTVVPDENLFGSTKQFVLETRKRLGV
jgi:hypothetical protein